MNAEHEKTLLEKFPKLFKGYRQGFACGDGWYQLIDALCGLLEWEAARNPSGSHPVALQVKEKFGTLRFYVSGANEHQRGYVTFAEYLSGRTCESCGTTEGVAQTSTGWIRTTCAPCEEKRLAVRAAANPPSASASGAPSVEELEAFSPRF